MMLFRKNEMISPERFSWNPVFSAIFLTGILLRAVALWQNPVMSRDALTYIRYAANFPSAEGAAPPFPVMLILLLRLLRGAGFSWETAGWLINLTAGALLIPVMYGIVLRIWNDRKWALLAALFTAVHPGLIKLSIVIQRDSPYLLFFWGCVYFLLCLLTGGGWPSAVAAGILTGCAVMTRFEGLELFFLWGITAGFIWKKYGAKKMLFLGTVTALPCLLILAAGLCLPGPWDLGSIWARRFLFLQKAGL